VTVLDCFARWRVRLGYPLAVVVLLLARPTPRSIVLGALVGAVGLIMRTWAAGYLHKQEILTTAGPYAHTRNPLYFGSSILAVGAAIATHSWWAAALLLGYFALVYRLVMRREEIELRAKHGAAFDAYAARVPLFLPHLIAGRETSTANGGFRWSQYNKNHEYQAALGFLLLLLALSMIWRLRAHGFRCLHRATTVATHLQASSIQPAAPVPVAVPPSHSKTEEPESYSLPRTANISAGASPKIKLLPVPPHVIPPPRAHEMSPSSEKPPTPRAPQNCDPRTASPAESRPLRASTQTSHPTGPSNIRANEPRGTPKRLFVPRIRRPSSPEACCCAKSPANKHPALPESPACRRPPHPCTPAVVVPPQKPKPSPACNSGNGSSPSRGV
jgi:protein-S-isoprenylcysteine O-methyltransferase Ste14